MLSIDAQKRLAILHIVEHKSQRAIAQDLKVHRNTVKRYTDTIDEWRQSQGKGMTDDELMKKLIGHIEHNGLTGKKFNDDFVHFVESELKKGKNRNRMELFGKIRGKRIQFYVKDTPVEVNCDVGYSTLCEAVKKIEGRISGPLFHRPKRNEKRADEWE